MIILTLSEAAASAPLSRSSLTDSVLPQKAASMRGVHPSYERRQDNKDTNTTQSSVISCCVL